MDRQTPAPPDHAAVARRRWVRRARRSNYRGEVCAPSGGSHAAARRHVKGLERERDELREALLRSRAEFENYRRRVQREREETNRRAGEELINALLPVLDNLQRALSAAQTTSDLASVLKGVAMIHEQFRGALLSRGLTPVETAGRAFDPAIHEAVGVEPRDDVPENQIVQTLQDGYLLGGRLLRPAMVRVAKKPG